MTRIRLPLTSLAAALASLAACGSVEETPGSGVDAGSVEETADAASSSPDFDAVFAADRVLDLELALTEQDYSELFDDPDTEIYVPAELVFDGEEVGAIGVRLKGNSSFHQVEMAGGTRYSLKLDFDRVDQGLTLHGLKKLNLANGFKDPTLLRERIAYDMFRAMGVPAGRTAHVNVYINGELWGLYTMIQQVDKTFLREHFSDDDGDLYKPELRAGSLTYRGDDITAYPDANLKTNEETSDHSDFLRFVDVLNNTPDASFEAAIAEVLDIEAFLRYLAVSTALTNLDSYQGMGHNYYLYFDPATGLATVVPWDLNEAFGAFTCGRPPDAMYTFPVDEPTCGPVGERPLIDRVLAVPSFREAYEGYLAEIAAGPLAPATSHAAIDELASLIRDDVAADPTKFYPLEVFEAGLDQGSPGAPGQPPTPPGLKRFASQRVSFIDSQL